MLHPGQGHSESGSGDNRSATLPEQLCPLSLVKKANLIEMYVPSHTHHSISTQSEDGYVAETDIITTLCCVVFFFNKINAALNFYTMGRDFHIT